ncbi:MAG: HNH endonuclease signature motif containing protein, partial [Terracoccus sp.]
ALGLGDVPAELPGHGYLAASQARELMTAPGSIWHALLADLDTGKALALYRKGYRPTPEMIAHVRAVDGVCRAPGCTVLAGRCDLDHVEAFDHDDPDATTTTSNLSATHRRHHRLKTAGLWDAERDPESGLVKWRTAAGRTYTTHPKDWLEHLRSPERRDPGPPEARSASETMEAASAHPAADEPPPF